MLHTIKVQRRQLKASLHGGKSYMTVLGKENQNKRALRSYRTIRRRRRDTAGVLLDTQS